jgi:hypothetical protein
MKLIIKRCLLCSLLIATPALAHTLHFTLDDNGDNTVELSGMYSTGEIAANTPVTLFGKEKGNVLWHGKTDEDGYCIFTRPAVPYEVELDAGAGHQCREDGI